jgi:hypothetical protein
MDLTVLYKKIYRKIHIGKKGGRFLLINKKRVYLSKKQIKQLLKNKVTDDKNKVTDDKNKVTDDKNKVTDDKNKVTDDKNKVTDYKNKVTDNKPNIIISYNLSWATQKDVITGSEIKHVKACRKKYGKKAVPYKKLSGCSQSLCDQLILFNKNNPLNLFDILCIQEGTKEYTELMFNTINKTNKYDYHLSKINSVSILGVMYKRIFGKPIEIFKGLLESKDRPIHILYFKVINTLVINAHFPHNVDINNLVKDKIIPHIKKYIGKSRIIFCGDFNDADSQLIKGKNAELKHLKLKIKNAVVVKSCCFNDNFDNIGDYIFDSKKTSYFGLLPNCKSLGSDHKPVISINELKILFN